MRFQKWLKENGFEIIAQYDSITNSIIFKKGELRFEFRPDWYNGNKVGAYTVLHNPNARILLKTDSIISCCRTQQEAIEEFSAYCKENNLI